MGTLRLMYIRLRAFVIVISFILVITSGCYCYYKWDSLVIECNRNNTRVLSSTSEIQQVSISSENTATCDLAGLSNLVKIMLADGFRITEELYEEDTIVVDLEKDDLILKLIYKVTEGKLLCIGKDYSKSYIPFTYIVEEKGNQVYE